MQAHAHTHTHTQGHMDAQFMLGYGYLNGEAVAMDMKLARGWLGKAAKQGSEQAQSALLMAYGIW